ncbi:hypothetical protein AX16_004192 [Volvariella volvacea WC 439]|nr:hypothetical protein AX16_004192 [Volvariella volvacea WC 439]
MGAGQSKSDIDEKVFYNETPIQFSQDVVNHLADNLASTDVSPERQSSLDAHIRARIQAEIEHLRREEEDVRQQIEAALEKESLDRDRSSAGEVVTSNIEGGEESDTAVTGSVKHSAALLGDLEELKNKVDKYHAKKGLEVFPSVKADSEAVVNCYRANPTTPLNCWREVESFKASVSRLEQEYLNSLP